MDIQITEIGALLLCNEQEIAIIRVALEFTALHLTDEPSSIKALAMGNQIAEALAP